MKIFFTMLLLAFIPVFITSLLFFVFILELMDLFSNLWRYLAHDATIPSILTVSLLYLPKCISYALPISLLFSVSFTLGNLYMNNELIAMFAAGVSLYRLVIPFLLIGLISSIAIFFFDNSVVIDTLRQKNQLFRTLVHMSVSYSNTNVTVISSDTRVIYQSDYYNDKKETLTKVTLIIRDEDFNFKSRIDADWAQWQQNSWVFHNCRIIEWNSTDTQLIHRQVKRLDSPELNEKPSTFRKTTRRIEEMKQNEALKWVQSLKQAGLPYRHALTEYYKKFFLALNPFIVTLISAGIGSAFKKNILLMHLLTALILSVIYYVAQMITVILSKGGYIPPLAGAGSSFILFLAAGIYMLRRART